METFSMKVRTFYSLVIAIGLVLTLGISSYADVSNAAMVQANEMCGCQAGAIIIVRHH